MTDKIDDGLVAPAGYEIDRWPDESPRMINASECSEEEFWLSTAEHPAHGKSTNLKATPVFGKYRITLKKKPERKLLTLSEAVAAHQNSNIIRCQGETTFEWLPHTMYPRCSGMAAVPLEWLVNRTDFYVSEDGQ